MFGQFLCVNEFCHACALKLASGFLQHPSAKKSLLCSCTVPACAQWDFCALSLQTLALRAMLENSGHMEICNHSPFPGACYYKGRKEMHSTKSSMSCWDLLLSLHNSTILFHHRIVHLYFTLLFSSNTTLHALTQSIRFG